jgi:hypothetical protein
MVSWVFRYHDGVAFHLCDACGRRQAAHQGLRLPLAHEAAAETRKGSGRSRWSVQVSRAPQTDDWLYHVQCNHCAGPTEDELNAWLREHTQR